MIDEDDMAESCSCGLQTEPYLKDDDTVDTVERAPLRSTDPERTVKKQAAHREPAAHGCEKREVGLDRCPYVLVSPPRPVHGTRPVHAYMVHGRPVRGDIEHARSTTDTQNYYRYCCTPSDRF